jgi:alkylated DNA repair protein alkB family protein 4
MIREVRGMTAPDPLPPLLANDGLSHTEETGEQTGIHHFAIGAQSAKTCPSFSGVYVLPDFVSETEALALLGVIDRTSFLPSQSGKQKQHYGPKVNFNKRRVNADSFSGLPSYAASLEARLRERIAVHTIRRSANRDGLTQALSAYETTDVFVLRYRAEDLSNLDFHLDDVFAYGELILDLSLESDSVMTFYRGRPGGEIKNSASEPTEQTCIRVPIPARSMLVLFGAARYDWEHAILAADVVSQRTSITLRTLGRTVLETEAGRAVLERARQSSSDE